VKVYFLGTGTSQGIPIIVNILFVVAPILKTKDSSIDSDFMGELYFVVDCGPDFRQQMLASKCDKMDGIIFTHEHSDHTAGIDDIRPFNFRQGEIPVYAHHRVIENLNKRFEYVLKPLIGILERHQ
jgi:phosphoribosyl 1,2-cyclic phosphate phosphodiesterase